MNASRRPPPPEAVSPRRVAEGAGRALQKVTPIPEHSLGEDLVNEVMRSHLAGACELGPYIRDEDQSVHPNDSGRLGGQPRAILFDGQWWDWFAKRTPEQRQALAHVARYLAADEKRQQALFEIIDHYIEHGIVVRSRKRLAKAGAALAVTAFAAVQWGATVVEWAVGKVPLIRSIISLWKGQPP